MAVILLPLNLCLLIALSQSWLSHRGQYLHWIQAVLLGTTAFGVWLVFITEFLSLFTALHFYPLVGSWAGLSTVLFALGYHRRNNLWPRFTRPSFSGFQLTLIGIIIFFALVTGGIGAISAPTNWDSMTYHLPRVMHWVQNQHVAHYATAEVRQLYQNPWAEFLITHLYLLSRSDRLFFLVQWVAMGGCILGVSLIARLLGADISGQILAGLVTVTLPMGLLQSISTQNDYVVAFWLVCFVVFMLLARQNPAQNLYLWAMSISLGLAILTKGTAYIFAAPFLFWFGLTHLKRPTQQIWQFVGIVTLVVLLINGTHYYRNYHLFGSLFSPDLGGNSYANQPPGLAALISNIPRNLALHFSVPIPAIAHSVELAVLVFHFLLGLNPQNPATTWPGSPFRVPPFAIDESVSGNFVHLCLVFISLAVIIWWRIKRAQRFIFIYAAVLVLSFLLFAFYLKWQPWHSRLHLPLFVLAAPLIGLMLSRLRYRPLAAMIAVGLVIQAMPFLLRNPLHPVLSRQNILTMSRSHQYFLGNPALEEFYTRAVNEIVHAQCNQLGLIMPIDAWEYPFWVLSAQLSPVPVQIQSVEVENQSRILADSTFHPCAVVCLQCQPADFDKYTQLMGPPRFSSGSDRLFIATPVNQQ
jgi:4-amino-4-deoxy-L-arabinose transferase-like glycosyltransferase